MNIEIRWPPAVVAQVRVLGGISHKGMNIEIRICLNFKARNNSGVYDSRQKHQEYQS